jgi:glycosyltransferase involved in cell wall biosynthesis
MKDKKSNILHLTLSMDSGGIENLILTMARHIDKDQYSMVVGCLDSGGVLLAEVEKLGIDTFVLSRKPGFDLGLVFRLAGILRRKNISIVHTHNQAAHFYGTLAALFSPVRSVITTEHSRHQIDGHWRRRMEKKILSYFTSTIVEVSEELKTASIERDKVSAEKIEVIVNGIDIEMYSAPSTRLNSIKKEYRVGDFAVTLGIVGRLHPIKNHTLLLSAFKELKEFSLSSVQLLIIGEGELREELERECSELGITDFVTFCGYRNDIPELFSIIDCLVLCSHSEGLPLTLLEAMAAGVPIVVTTGANRSRIIENDKNGITVESTPSSLAVGIMRALSQKECLVPCGRETVQHYSVTTMVEHYQNIYCSGMNTHKS